MHNAFGECRLSYSDNVFQRIVSKDASTDTGFDSTEESKGLFFKLCHKEWWADGSYSQNLTCS